MKRKLAFIISAVLAVGTVLSSCQVEKVSDSNTNGNSGTIKIGVFEPLTGANAGGGELEVEGIKLANKLYPEVNGKKIELVVVDNKSDKVEASNAASRLVEKEKVTAIIGSYGSSLSMAAGDIVKKAKIPTVATSATNPLVTKGNDYYFRVCFIDPFQGTVMANYAYSKLNAKKVAIVQEVSNDYAVGLAKYFTDSFTKLTGDSKAIISTSNYNTGDQDFSAQLTNIKSQNPDVIFAPGNFTESALLIKQARDLGIKAPIIGGDTWETPDFLKIGGQAAEGAVFSTAFATEKPVTKESEKFLEAYKKEYSGKDASAMSALGYDSYLILVDALKRSGSNDSVKLRDELAKTKDFQGATGVINFDEDRNAIKAAIIKTVKDGKFTYTDTVEPTK
ncbi:ABC transporter substrate-binding protein [Clostridium folliculivorans]|uniref:Branched-chain amino acid ABC transporter substrate-binding protein n=1 Tax=Clostridium folliculivorans TaxID=2886038 RepID=A0A9W6DDD1_9CLOT|nr:ABC transporter substrate-binding protein [Clostridium folliculivorans]GKU27706.1 branched-chain amino acid ABC transporter substrate-binding protein [Clostridium folliculivorans]GKU32466.1 branched-chain amino acid ABC transporter substrate-binding protein [Clostridium folliculivorans]